MIFNGSSLVSTASIFNNANWGYYTGLVLDNSDKARTIQFGHAGYFLNYSQNTTGIWVNNNISGYGTYYNYPVIALDSNNKSHLLTSQLWGSYGTLGLMQHWYQNNTNAWQIETVVSDSRGHSNLVFSNSGIPNAAYVNASNEVKLVSKSGSTWQSETVGTFAGVRGDGISIALSPKGQVYIAAMDSKTLRLYTKINSVWQYYLLNSNFVTPTIQSKPASILFDNGEPIVIYNDATTIFKATLKSTTPDSSLLSKFSPVMSFYKDDYLPSGIDVFINHSVLYMSKFSGDIAKKYGNALPNMISYENYFDISKSKISLNKFPTLLTNTKETFYLDILNHTSYEGSGKDTINFFYDNGNSLPDELFYRPYELMSSNEKIVYGRVLNQNGKKYLQYHFFYLINQWNDNGGKIIGYHEGDWEGMIVELDEFQNPQRVTVSAHMPAPSLSYKGGETRNWSNVSKIGNHPVVYIGKGAHPTYFTKGTTDVSLNLCYYFTDVLFDSCEVITGTDNHGGIDLIMQNSNLNTNSINRYASKINYRIVNIETDANVKKWLNSSVIWGQDYTRMNLNGLFEKSVQAPKYYDPDRWDNSKKWMDDRE